MSNETRATADTGVDDERDEADEHSDEAIEPIVAVKLLLFLVWWFAGIGVGTALLSPVVIGTSITATQFLVIILSFFCSGLLIIALVPGRTDEFAQSAIGAENDDGDKSGQSGDECLDKDDATDDQQ